MDIKARLQTEKTFLNRFEKNALTISTTAKEAVHFNVLPRRELANIGMSSFMINDESLLKQTLDFFDGVVDEIYIDIEQKQTINLYKIATQVIKKSSLLTVKPNDMTVESLDLLIRHHYADDIMNKNVAMIGTGNLASKIAMRLGERQANIFIKGRSIEKETKTVRALNLFLPAQTKKIKTFPKSSKNKSFDIIISALSGPFQEEAVLHPYLTQNSLIVDVGINNFSRYFIEHVLHKQINIIRLDTRIALAYQFLLNNQYTDHFFNDVYGKALIKDIRIVSGGYIGRVGDVIVDHLKNPQQIIGIADGYGGVKGERQLTEREQHTIKKIKQFIVSNH